VISAKVFEVLVVVNLIGLMVLAAFYFTDKDTIVFIDSTKVISAYDGMAELQKG